MRARYGSLFRHVTRSFSGREYEYTDGGEIDVPAHYPGD